VNLIATADGGSTLSGWSGACTGGAGCSFTMNADRSVTATFAQLLNIRIGGVYFPMLQNAFDAALNADVIQAQSKVFTDLDLVFYNIPAKQVKFKGGYDGTFATINGVTTLDGKLSIRNGTVRVEKLAIK
jgi:hypothetical protein